MHPNFSIPHSKENHEEVKNSTKASPTTATLLFIKGSNLVL